jgi:hypothetical protein
MVVASHDTSPPGPQTAVAFLRRHGQASLISLGCGPGLNRLDNHLRLFAALNLTYYVGIDCVPAIAPGGPDRFVDPEGMAALLSAYYEGQPQRFQDAVRVFPNTWVEELAGIHCAAVVCQRVLPDCRWEETIVSMTPRLVLQEDLHGCERQQLKGRGYVRTWKHIRRYGLEPFRPWPVFPGERNFILWRRRDFDDEAVERSRWRLWWRLCERCLG